MWRVKSLEDKNWVKAASVVFWFCHCKTFAFSVYGGILSASAQKFRLIFQSLKISIIILVWLNTQHVLVKHIGVVIVTPIK